MIFDAYAKYYNLLYSDKDYSGEVDYVISLIKRYSNSKAKTLLDIGCGTGNHAVLFSKNGFLVAGVDSSSEMIKIAKSKESDSLHFQVADATSFSLSLKFDVAVSLFHVINYHITYDLLNKAFASASKHIETGGLFIFDTWYGPSVLSEKPVNRIKELEDERIKVVRTATSELKHEENVVVVDYDITVMEKTSSETQSFSEKHIVRYLFKPEIEKLLNDNSFELIQCEEWLTGKNPDLSTWGVCFVGRKK